MADCSYVTAFIKKADIQQLVDVLGEEPSMELDHSRFAESEWGYFAWESVAYPWNLASACPSPGAPFILDATGHYSYPGMILVWDGEKLFCSEALDLGDGPVIPVVRVRADGSIDQDDHENCVLPLMRAAYKIQKDAGIRAMISLKWPEDEEA